MAQNNDFVFLLNSHDETIILGGGKATTQEQLSADMRAASDLACGDRPIVAISGVPSTALSLTLHDIAERHIEAGWRVQPIALSWSGAKALAISMNLPDNCGVAVGPFLDRLNRGEAPDGTKTCLVVSDTINMYTSLIEELAQALDKAGHTVRIVMLPGDAGYNMYNAFDQAISAGAGAEIPEAQPRRPSGPGR